MKTDTTSTIQPTDWHTKPPKFKNKPCPLCGYPSYGVGEHRATTADEKFDRKFVRRRETKTGEVIEQVGEYWPDRAPSRAGYKHSKPRAGGITARVRKGIIRATMLLARGKTFFQIADALSVPVAHIYRWQSAYPDLWAAAEDKASEALVEIVRANVGTNEVLKDPDAWFRMAERAEKWAQEHGTNLFEHQGDVPSLSTFFESYFQPNCMPDVSERTRTLYEIIVKRWRLTTGDPPMDRITTDLLAKFRDYLAKSRGQRPGTTKSAVTVRGYLRHVNTILSKAGPPCYQHRDAAGLIPFVPWVKPPRGDDRRLPKVVALEHLGVVYEAAARMIIPEVPGVSPGDWWRALFVVCYNTGLRRRTLFEMRMADIDWIGHQINLPPQQLKSRRAQIVHLNETAYEHLRRIKTDREFVFPWPFDLTHFHATLHRLQYDAGLPRKFHFGLHELRSTLATVLWEQSPSAAQWALGHASPIITRDYYVRGDKMIARALDGIPQPDAFKAERKDGQK